MSREPIPPRRLDIPARIGTLRPMVNPEPRPAGTDAGKVVSVPDNL